MKVAGMSSRKQTQADLNMQRYSHGSKVGLCKRFLIVQQQTSFNLQWRQELSKHILQVLLKRSIVTPLSAETQYLRGNYESTTNKVEKVLI